MKNTLCNARVVNPNKKSLISHFILMTVREYMDYDGGTYIDEIKNSTDLLYNEHKAIDEPFYRIYGEKKEKDDKINLIFITEFFHINHAINFLYDITGEHPTIVSY